MVGKVSIMPYVENHSTSLLFGPKRCWSKLDTTKFQLNAINARIGDSSFKDTKRTYR